MTWSWCVPIHACIMGRHKRRTFVLAETDEFAPLVAEPGYDTAYVQIGSLRITNHGLGERLVQRRPNQRRSELQEESSDSESDSSQGSGEGSDDAAVKDYMANLAMQEDEDDSEGGNGPQAGASQGLQSWGGPPG